MELHEALYTTRAMRRVRPDPIPLDVPARILDAAVRASVRRQPAELALPLGMPLQLMVAIDCVSRGHS